MADVNRVILLGRLTRDPNLRQTNSGKSVCNLTVATNKEYTDENGNKKEITSFHDISIFGRLAEICAERLRESSSVFIEGELSYRERSGATYTTILASNIQFL